MQSARHSSNLSRINSKSGHTWHQLRCQSLPNKLPISQHVQQCRGFFAVWSYFGCHTCCGRSKSLSKDVGRPQRIETVCAAQGATAGNLGGGDGLQQELLTALSRHAVAFYKFTRPHTMIGTFVSVVSISLLALQNQGLATVDTCAAMTGLMQALTSALLMNIAIVGINQLFDVEIDKINKPYLPLASGEFSMQTGTAIVVSTAAASLAIGIASGSAALMATLVASLVLGIVYSVELPFMRWKRSPVLAAACILAVRAVAVQLGFFFHMQSVLVSSAIASSAGLLTATPGVAVGHLQVTPAITFTVCFMLFFSVVIALFKDVPDSKGDKIANVRTLTVRLGVHRVFWACIWLLTAAYAGAIIYSVLAAHFTAAATHATATASLLPIMHTPVVAPAPALGGSASLGAAMPASLSLLGANGGTLGLRTLACVMGHAILGGLLWQRALNTDLSSNASITSCYMHVWKLFYAEYVLIPLLL